VPLVGPDFPAIVTETEALLVVFGNDKIQFRTIEWSTILGHQAQKVVYFRPAISIKCKTNGLGFMTENQTDFPAGTDELFRVHDLVCLVAKLSLFSKSCKDAFFARTQEAKQGLKGAN
jgi:hypothetical protein